MEQVDFSPLKFPKEAEVSFEANKVFLKYWLWDYEEFLLYQKQFQDFVRKNKEAKIFIFTNHPHCFTLGRGNERGNEELVDFDEDFASQLAFPLHRIHRGGGITYHYPGQWIFYPIVSVSPSYTLNDHMCWLLKTVKNYINNTYDLNSIATQKIMGVWLNKSKLASIGVGLNRFVTEHGLAFNLNYDEKMGQELAKINPCGLNSETYIFLNQVLGEKALDIEIFHEGILSTIKD